MHRRPRRAVVRRFSVFHLGAADRLPPVNTSAEFLGGSQMTGARRRLDAARLADPAVSMKLVAAVAAA